MTIEDMDMLVGEKEALCNAACVMALLKEVCTREESSVALDLNECIQQWNKVRLGYIGAFELGLIAGTHFVESPLDDNCEPRSKPSWSTSPTHPSKTSSLPVMTPHPANPPTPSQPQQTPATSSIP